MNKGLLIVLLILFSGSVLADSFRCGNKLVKSGDSSNILLKKCGNPQRKLKTYITVKEGGRKYSTRVTNWVYERKGKKDMIVSVYNHEVLKIRPD